MKPSFGSIQDKLNDLAEKLMGEATSATAKELGLDSRSAYQFYIGDDFIAIDKNSDRNLQYYGGFEYVDKDCRMELGEYVLYSADNNRVCGHLNHFKGTKEDEGSEG